VLWFVATSRFSTFKLHKRVIATQLYQLPPRGKHKQERTDAIRERR
jgi:hypothetical protein